MSVMTPVHSRFFLAIGSSFVMVAGMLFGANIAAAADSVQVQSYQRASQTANCDSPPASMTEWRASWANPNDPTSGPTWHPSWERWANNGNGGWTCTRSITWARSATSARSYALGDIGPGGGLVFYIDSGSGLRYEMAPKNWRGSSSDDTPELELCESNTVVPLAVGIAVGTGAANTAAMADPTMGCESSPAATAALAYPGTNGSAGQWFIPSLDELNAMCYYSRNLSASSDPTVSCDGDAGTSQDGTFASGAYGFAGDRYWSSSQHSTRVNAWRQNFDEGDQGFASKGDSLRVRPVRAF